MQPSIYFNVGSSYLYNRVPYWLPLKSRDPTHSSFHKFGKNDPFQVGKKKKKIIKK